MKAGMGVMLTALQVDLYGGDTVSIKIAVGTRRASQADITAGASADRKLIATIDYDDWIAKAGRDPQKGDVIWWLGNRHAIVKSIPAAPGGNGIFFKAELAG